MLTWTSLLLVELWLQICHWQAQLFGSNYEARHCIRDSPTCQVLDRPKQTSWGSSPLLSTLLEENLRLRDAIQALLRQGFWKLRGDADFFGNWNKHLAPFDPSTAKSRSGWIVLFYAGCLVIWASKLQTQGVLSTTEAEYITMSQYLGGVLPIMFLVQEICEKGFPVICTKPYVYCKVFEDNSSALELVRLPKLCPHTKHINVWYHCFCKHVRNGLIKVFPVGTRNQITDALTKALPQNDFQRYRCYMCGL
jgi:hypothetical protein